ncbi:hypothetical protein [Kitasatospora sp. NPDC094015]|uniref:hypothetical protein n=1 Tax=Kitasatospora sp. NPDC094015 TaxID=3155205 RepID=UPI00332473A1
MSDQPEDDRFEEELVRILRRVGDDFHTGPAEHERLAGGGAVYGRRLGRRRAVAVAGAAAALALTVTGTFALGLLPGLLGARPAELPPAAAPSGPLTVAPAAPTAVPTAAPSVSATPQVTEKEMVALLTSLLPPDGRVVASNIYGTGPADPEAPDAPSATVTVEDADGLGTVVVVVDRLAVPVDLDPDWLRCQDKKDQPFTLCSRQAVAGGGFVTIEQHLPLPGGSADRRVWTATLITPAGTQVTVMEWNFVGRNTDQVTRKAPPLSTEELKAIATSRVWDRPASMIRTPRQPGPTPAAAAVVRLPAPRMMAIAAPQLPAGAIVTEPGGVAGRTHLLVDTGRGPGLVEIIVQDGKLPLTGQAGADGFEDAKPMPDGTRVRYRQEKVSSGAKGVVREAVDVLRPDRLLVTVQAYNSPSPAQPASLNQPVLTPEQLTAVAMAPGWRVARKA